MKMIFVVDGTVVAHGSAFSANATVSCDVPGAVVYEVAEDSLIDAGWSVAEVDGQPQFAAPARLPPSIGPNEFHFLWTISEQVAIEEIRATDKGVDLFMKRLEDIRTVEVVLAAPPVQAGIGRTIDALVKYGTIAADQAPVRLQEILSCSWRTD